MKNLRAFYVYEHWRPDRDECFYVGKGRGSRAHKMHKRSRWHHYIQDKLHRLGSCVEVRVVADGLTEMEAFRLEIERIALWRSDGADLVNMTDGGEGSSGCKRTEESKKRHSQRMKGVRFTEEHKRNMSRSMREKKHSSFVCKPRTPEHRENLSKALTGRSVWNKGKTGIYSPEARAKMSESAKARKIRERAVK